MAETASGTGETRVDRLWSENAPRAMRERRDLRPAVLVGQAAALLRATLNRERPRWFLWSAVLFAAGIAVYFQLPLEPPVWAVVLLALIGAGLAVLAVRPGGSKISIAIAIVLAGFATGKLRTETGGPGAMPLPLGVVDVAGWLERLESRPGGKGLRLYVRPTAIAGVGPDKLPRTVLLTWRGKQARRPVRAGNFLRLKARFLDPLEPAWPGGYDPQFVRWFQGIGASGFLFGAPSPAAAPGAPPFLIGWRTLIERVRETISDRLRGALAGGTGAVATALITGDRSAISEEDRDNLRAAGLAHLLAISGLHMALFAGGVFWLFRALLALNPILAARWPIKKWAALLALLAAGGYLLISGAGLATQRAFIMVVIMFLAILCDRPALSMRNIALAAIVVLLLRPESLMSVSFQLSFMAVIGLVALFEIYDAWRTNRGDIAGEDSRTLRLLKRGADYLGRIAATTLVAGLVTAPIAAFHFNKVALYSLLGNLIAIPTVGMLVMPAAIVALAAMPFGLESWPLVLMGQGIELVLETARLVAGMPGAVRLTPAVPDIAGLFAGLGLLWICLWRTAWRFGGVGCICAGLAIGHWSPLPEVLVAPGGRQVALRMADGKLAFSSARASKYVAGRWLLKFADTTPFAEAAKRKGFACDLYGCTGRARPGTEVAVVRHPSILAEECRRADIVVTTFKFRGACPSARKLITPQSLRSRGAHAFFVTGIGGADLRITVVTPRLYRGARPWNAAPVRIRRKPGPRDTVPQTPSPSPPDAKPKLQEPSAPPLQVRI